MEHVGSHMFSVFPAFMVKNLRTRESVVGCSVEDVGSHMFSVFSGSMV